MLTIQMLQAAEGAQFVERFFKGGNKMENMTDEELCDFCKSAIKTLENEIATFKESNKKTLKN